MKSAIASALLAATVASADDKVQVALYYEAQCPGCRQTITTSFAHAYGKSGFLDMADITFVPYGNASETGPDSNGDYSYTCQHGPTECQYNLIESCGLNLIENPMDQFNFINCIENNDDSRSSTDYDSVLDKCANQADVASQTAAITSCYKGSMGNGYEHAMATKTNALNPAHTYVPYVTGKNGVHSDTIQDAVQRSLFLYVCFEYTGSNKSLECLLAEEEYKLEPKVDYPVSSAAALFLN